MDRVAILTSRANTALNNNIDFLALPRPVTNSQALAQVDALTRQMNGLFRLLLRGADDTAGT
jgi:hypothetical protein